VEAVDPSTLRALRREVAEEVIGRVLRAWLDELPPRMSAIHSAIEQADAEAMREAAHALRGSSISLGGALVAEICKQLELEARAGRLTSAPALVARLDAAAEETAAAFEDQLGP
jgi:HPt (histidine-containing phosphotransfer) domain-containing protein